MLEAFRQTVTGKLVSVGADGLVPALDGGSVVTHSPFGCASDATSDGLPLLAVASLFSQGMGDLVEDGFSDLRFIEGFHVFYGEIYSTP